MRTQVKFTDTDTNTGKIFTITGTIEAFQGDYVFVIGNDNKFYKVFYGQLTFVKRINV